MNINQIRNLYTEYVRRTPVMHGMRREDVYPIVRYVALNSTRSLINYSQVNAEILDDTIEREILYFTKLRHVFEWKVYDYDTPVDLRDRLAARGFEIGEDEAVMVLDTQDLPDRLQQPTPHDIRVITDHNAVLPTMNAVQDKVFGDGRGEENWVTRYITANMRDDPDTLHMVAAYVDDKPVSAAWTLYIPNAPFAGLYGGATLEAHRGKGYYSALVAARAKHAIANNVRYLTVDASPMSRPILEKLGFVQIATACEANYTPATVIETDN